MDFRKELEGSLPSNRFGRAVAKIFMFAAYATHVIICIGKIPNNIETMVDLVSSLPYVLLLIAGAISPIVGVLHGFGRWIGAW